MITLSDAIAFGVFTVLAGVTLLTLVSVIARRAKRVNSSADAGRAACAQHTSDVLML
jgi:hypothetical protein